MSLIPQITSDGAAKEIHGSPTLRTILNRADGLHDGTPSQFVISKVADTQLTVFQARMAEMALVLRATYDAVGRGNGRLATAFCGGFGVPLLVALFLFWPVSSAPMVGARPVSLNLEQHSAVLAALQDRTVSAFAAPSLMGQALSRSLSNEAPLALIVPSQVEAEVGRATSFSINFTDGGQVPAGAVVRIASLPPYVGLSAGKPGASGTWIVDPQAVSDLSLTVYTVNSAPQIVDIDLVDLNGGLLARAHTQLAVKLSSLDLPPRKVPVDQLRETVVAANRVVSQPTDVVVLKPSTPKSVSAPKIGIIKVALPVQVPVASPKRSPIAINVRAPKDSARSARPTPKAVARPLPPRVTVSKVQAPPIEVAATSSGPSTGLPKERSPAAWSSAWQRSTLGYAQDRP